MASASHAETEDQATRIEEVVVTAQRTSQKIQSVPVAVTALDQAALEKKSISDVEDLGLHIPNMHIRKEVAVNGMTISMRGISVASDNFSFDSAVGVYINEIFIARTNDFGATFFDVGNIQVLRGPQGTLFGRNTPAGAVLIETKRPGKTYGGYILAGLGGGGHGVGDGADRTIYQFEGAVDLPISPMLGVRLAGYYVNDDGWARSRTTGYKNFSRDDGGARATVEFTPSDKFDATLVVDQNKTRGGVPMRVPLEFIAPFPAQPFDVLNGGTRARDGILAQIANPDPYANDSEFTNQVAKGKSNSATLQMKYNLSDDWTLRSISGWRHIRRSNASDNDFTQFKSSNTTADIGQTQYSQEVVLTGDVTSRLHLTAGAFYFRETGFDENIVDTTIRNAGTPAAFVDLLLLRGQDFRNVAKAGFINLAYDILPNLTASVGFRQTDEKKRVVLAGRFLTSGLPFTSGTETFADKVPLYDTKLTWKATPDLLVYAKYGTGYRAGGIGFRGPDAQFAPETSKTYEAGVKWDFDIASMPMRLNTAIFDTSYRAFQIGVVLLNPTRQIVINAGEASIRGAEFELTMKPTPNLEIEASLGLLDAKYDSFIFINQSLGGRIDLTNNNLREAPDVTLGVSAGYTVPSSVGEWLFQVDYSYSSSYETESVYQPKAPPIARTNAFHQGPTGTWNARVRLAEAFGSNVDLSAWAKNITDEKRLAYGLASGNLRAGSYAEPLSYGIEVRAHF